MKEFYSGELYSSSGHLVTDEQQAKAIALSVAQRLEETSMATRRKKAAKKVARKTRKKAAKKRVKKTDGKKTTKKSAKKKFSKAAYKAAIAAGKSGGEALAAGWGRTAKKRTTKKRTTKKRTTKKRARKVGKRAAPGQGTAYLASEHKRLVDKTIRLEKELAAAKDKPKRRKASKKRRKTAKKRGPSIKPARRTAKRVAKTLGKFRTARAVIEPTITANQIIKRRTPGQLKLWLCAGTRRTGCGGGKANRKGSRVVGHLR
jgi:hypothetical protein